MSEIPPLQPSTPPELPPQPPAPPSIPGPLPFAPSPKPLPGGCSRPLVVGCGIVIVLVGLAGIAFVVKAKDLLAWTMRQVQAQVSTALPADVTDAERARLERGFDAAISRMQKGEVETPALYALQSQLMNAAEKSQKKTITRDDVLDLLSALERVGGLLEPTEEEGEAPEAETVGPAPVGVEPAPAGAEPAR